MLYDRGLNPDGLYWEDAVANHTMLRAELACVVYRKGKDAKPTRKMEISIPSLLKGDDKPFIWSCVRGRRVLLWVSCHCVLVNGKMCGFD